MINIRKITLIFGLLLLVNQSWAGGQLQDFEGKNRSIKEFQDEGKWLVVMMWASDCHVCNSEVHAYNDFHEWNYDKNATVLGISTDGLAKKTDAEAFIKRHSVSFKNLIGEGDAVASIYTELTGQSWIGTPTFLVFSPSGKLMAQQVGAVPVDLIEKFISRQSSKVSKVTIQGNKPAE